MQRTILNIIALLLFNAGFAQKSPNNNFLLQQITGEPFTNNYLMFDSNPFYSGDWVKGTVTLNSGITLKELDLKFDMYNNQLIYFNTTNKALVVIDNKVIKQFELTNKTGEIEVFKKMKIDSTDSRNDRYYGILVEDTISLVILYESYVNNYTSANPGTKKVGKFEQKKHYLFIQDGILKPLPRFKFSLYKLFPGIKSDLKNNIRQNKLQMRNKEHLTLIFNEINLLSK